MKTITILSLLIAALIYVSCKDNSTNITTPSTDLTLSGKIVNWSSGSSKYLVVSISKIGVNSLTQIDSSLIAPDGSFNLSIKALPDSLLDTMKFGACREVILSNQNAKGGMLRFEVDSAGISMGPIYRSNYNEDSINIFNPPLGFFTTYNLYSNLAVSATGSDTCVSIDTSIATYNLNISKGWGIMCGVVTYSSGNKVIWNVTNNEPAGGKWYYRTSPGFNGLYQKSKR